MSNNKGFTLIEVLIAVVVLSGGLLGLAALQATTLKNNQSAYYRSKATQLAYDMADRMRANFSDANNLTTSKYKTIVPTAATAQADCKTVSTTCTKEDMATNDLFEWNLAITDTKNGLPSGAGTIDVVAATKIFTITIQWDDDRDGDVDGNDPNFQMSFQI
jgi:type IV pilus assembly protein PilV